MDKNRFLNEFKLVATSNMKRDLGLAALVFLCTLCIFLLVGGSVMVGNASVVDNFLEGPVMMSSFLASLVAMYRCSLVFGNLNDKNEQMRLLTGPASVGEKFWARILCAAIAYMVFVILVYYLAVLLWIVFQTDGVRTAAYDFVFRLKHSAIPKALQGTLLNAVFSVLGCYSYVAFYAVGATYFRKHPFLYTTLVGLGAVIFLSLAFGMALGFISGYFDIELMDYIPSANIVACIVVAVYVVCSVLFTWWAYRRFTKLQYKSR